MTSRATAILLLAVGVACATPAYAQYRFDTWTTEDGLPQNGVREITQTPDGFLWFTTFDGLVRFDGIRFTTFSTGNTKGIINNRFTGLYGAKDGTLYATTMEDGILTVMRNGEFTSYNSQQVPGHYIYKIAPDERNELRFLVEDDDRTTKSWYYLRNGAFVFSEREDPNRTLTVTGRNGVVWKVTPTEATEVGPGGQATTYRFLDQPLNFRPNPFVDSTGHLWIGEYEVHRFGGGQKRTFGQADGLPRSLHHSFWEDTDGSIWFSGGGGATEGIGLIRYKDNTLQAFGMESGLLTRSLWSVFQDREGTTWIATDKGLARLRRKVLSSHSVKDGLIHSEVYPIFRDSKGVIWIGTSRGLSTYQNGVFAPLKIVPLDPKAPMLETWADGRASVQSLWEDPKGRIWAGMNGGLFIIENHVARAVRSVLGHHVFAIHGDRAGNIWAATNRGVLQFKDLELVNRLGVKSGLPNEFITTIYEDRAGTLWFGGFGGLSHFVGGQLTNYTTKEGLAGSYVRSIYEDADGIFWIGTYDEGLSRFKDGRFVNYNTRNGLYNNGVFAIQEDARGNFWISSNGGVYRVNRKELNDFADGRITEVHSVGYGSEDGMLSTECNGGRQPASLKDGDGRFWFPTQDGVVIVEPEQERYNARPPSVVIESATVEREGADIRNGLVIEPGLRNIEINFTGVSLIKSEQIKYRYRLEGHDPEWIDSGTRRTAYYSSLPPGDYRFRVKAANSDNIWNEEGATMTVQLKPFFYQTSWFAAACLVGAALLLVGFWRTSVRRFESREQELAKLVAEKTEELRKANVELQYLANSDELTSVANRRRFDDFLGDEWRRAIRYKTEISLVLLDIDHFKLFNDAYGHQAGDDCLKSVAAALKATIHRPTDLLARFGGEEFAIVLGGTEGAGAMKVAELALRKVNDLAIPHRASPTSDRVTISAGIAATIATAGMSEADFIKAADQALYRAKASGRNRIVAAATS